jgi:hypothetical protein
LQNGKINLFAELLEPLVMVRPLCMITVGIMKCDSGADRRHRQDPYANPHANRICSFPISEELSATKTVVAIK